MVHSWKSDNAEIPRQLKHVIPSIVNSCNTYEPALRHINAIIVTKSPKIVNFYEQLKFQTAQNLTTMMFIFQFFHYTCVKLTLNCIFWC